MYVYPDPFESDAALMCMGGEAGERLSWLAETTMGLSPAQVFDAVGSGRLPAGLSVIGRPGEILADLMVGDYVVSRVFGEGPIGGVRVADLDDPAEVYPGERLPADTAVLRMDNCGCATCRQRR